MVHRQAARPRTVAASATGVETAVSEAPNNDCVHRSLNADDVGSGRPSHSLSSRLPAPVAEAATERGHAPSTSTFFLHLTLGAIGVLILAELGARYGLGLGDPPVSVADAEIDYLFAPNQDCNRFGNRIRYNNLSMRCDFDVDENCETSRVYVVGDSVVNGGIFSDHEELATTLLQRELPKSQVCNISAGSWGPGNYAAYFRRHRGLRGGTLIVEVNSHDLWEDDPKVSGGRIVGKDVAFPNRKPCCALWDACCFVPKICRLMGFNIAAVNTKVDVPKWGEDADDSAAKWNLSELDWLFGEPFENKVLIIHRSRKETQDAIKVSVGEARFREWAKEKGVPCHLLELDADKDYRDSIHLNKNGQWKLYQLLRSISKESGTGSGEAASSPLVKKSSVGQNSGGWYGSGARSHSVTSGEDAASPLIC